MRKSAVLVELLWPAESPFRPFKNRKWRNIVKSCEIRESNVILDD